jgi:hypothetical protein
MTIQNLGTKTEVLNFLPNDVVTATVTASTAIDLVDYEGDIAVVLCAEAGSAGVTYLGKLTEADTSGGSLHRRDRRRFYHHCSQHRICSEDLGQL